MGGLAKVLGIPAIDVGPFYAAALDKARILSDPKCYGEAVRESLPVVVSNYYHLFGNGLQDRNLALPADPENLQDAKATLAVAKAVGARRCLCCRG